jgi:adenine-specific DNA-methyltransferase
VDDVRERFANMSREDLLDYILAQHEQGIRIAFAGKDVAKRIARKVQPRTSRRLTKYSVGSEEEQAGNQVIEGENMQALVTLYRERGQVDMILTDPPYNTGRDFRYNDKWDEDPNDPELGELVGKDDPGRHTKWMRFMLPRLKVMRDMLKPGGVLAICVDHRELFRLGQMLDEPELFGEANRIAIINWQKSYTTRADNNHVSTATEYVLVYAKDQEAAVTQLLPRTAATDARYRNPDGDPRLWKSGHAGGPNPETHPTMVYAIQHPFTGELIYPSERNCWRYGQATMKKWLEEWGSPYVRKDLGDGKEKALVLKVKPEEARKRAQERLAQGSWPRLFFGATGETGPQIKFYLEEIKQGIVPMTYWADDDYGQALDIGAVSWDHEHSGHSQLGVEELTAIVGAGHNFNTVKPLALFTKLMQIWCPPGGLVLDPFAGSGTTGHAALLLNKETGSKRRFILIEQGRPEKGDPYARSLMAQRLRRVISGDWARGDEGPLGGGFRFVQLQKTVDAKALLEMERDEMTDAVIASHYDANRRGGPGLILMPGGGYDYLVARNTGGEGFYLVWDGAAEPPVFDETVYDAVVAEALTAVLKPAYHVYARFNLFQSDDVRFYQIPDQILVDFGLDVTDAYNNESREL